MLAAFFADLLPLAPARIAGVALWSLALYLGFSPVGDRLTEGLYQRFKGQATAGEDRYALAASLLSVLPFLLAGILVNYGVELGLGRSWSLSVGIIACISSGVYELGRRDGQASDSD
jgi:hypothetical protein